MSKPIDFNMLVVGQKERLIDLPPDNKDQYMYDLANDATKADAPYRPDKQECCGVGKPRPPGS